MPDAVRRYAIIWARGDEVYTHSDEDGRTVTYTLDELEYVVGLSPQRIFTTLETLSVVKRYPQALHAVPVDTLERLLGVTE